MDARDNEVRDVEILGNRQKYGKMRTRIISCIYLSIMVLEKPVFLYATDLKDYLANEYEFLIDYSELPFDIADSTEQLCANILRFDRTECEKKIDEFLDKYGVGEDGRAGERVAEFIFSLLSA